MPASVPCGALSGDQASILAQQQRDLADQDGWSHSCIFPRPAATLSELRSRKQCAKSLPRRLARASAPRPQAGPGRPGASTTSPPNGGQNVRSESKTVFVTGGAGYVGAVLVPKLLARGHRVRVLDLFLFGEDVLPPHPSLQCIKGDIRDQALLKHSLPGSDIVIHLACISNDPRWMTMSLPGSEIVIHLACISNAPTLEAIPVPGTAI